MKNLFELRNAYEYKARLLKALETARQKLSEKDFEHFARQLNTKIGGLNEEIEEYEQTVLRIAVPGLVSTMSYRTYCVTGRTVTPLQPSIVGSFPWSGGTLLFGFGDSYYPGQMSLPLQGPSAIDHGLWCQL
jgi:hypothetical protein